MKQLIQNLLGRFGYRLTDLRKFGRDPWHDIQLLLRSTPAPICFDIGAHRGETTRAMIEHLPHATVHAFEPDPTNFAALQIATKDLPGARLHPLAVADRCRQSILFQTRFSQCNSLLPASAVLQSEAHQRIGEVAISVTTIDQFCLENKIDSLDFLKTDCQGLDLRVLQGAATLLSERRINVIQCESIFNSEYEGQGWFYEILEFLTKVGYAPVSFSDPTRNARHEITSSDVVFKRREP